MTSRKFDKPRRRQTTVDLIAQLHHKIEQNHQVSQHAQYIVDCFLQAGYEIFLTGNFFLQNPKDFDFTTPEGYVLIEDLFQSLGIPYVKKGEGKFHSYTVFAPSDVPDGLMKPVDITSLDPYDLLKDTLPLTTLLQQDALNRDFTRNCLYLDMRHPRKIFDFHHGIWAIYHNMVVPIQEPNQKLRETPSIILRAIRLYLRGAILEETLLNAIRAFPHQANYEGIGDNPGWTKIYAELQDQGCDVAQLLIHTFGWPEGSFTPTQPRALASLCSPKSSPPLSVSPILQVESTEPAKAIAEPEEVKPSPPIAPAPTAPKKAAAPVPKSSKKPVPAQTIPGFAPIIPAPSIKPVGPKQGEVKSASRVPTAVIEEAKPRPAAPVPTEPKKAAAPVRKPSKEPAPEPKLAPAPPPKPVEPKREEVKSPSWVSAGLVESVGPRPNLQEIPGLAPVIPVPKTIAPKSVPKPKSAPAPAPAPAPKLTPVPAPKPAEPAPKPLGQVLTEQYGTFWTRIGEKRRTSLLNIAEIEGLLAALQRNHLLQQEGIVKTILQPKLPAILLILDKNNLLNADNIQALRQLPKHILDYKQLYDWLETLDSKGILFLSTFHHILTYSILPDTIEGFEALYKDLLYKDHKKIKKDPRLVSLIENSKGSRQILQELLFLYRLRCLDNADILPCIHAQNCFSDLPEEDVLEMIAAFVKYMGANPTKAGDMKQAIAAGPSGIYLRGLLLFNYVKNHAAVFHEAYIKADPSMVNFLNPHHSIREDFLAKCLPYIQCLMKIKPRNPDTKTPKQSKLNELREDLVDTMFTITKTHIPTIKDISDTVLKTVLNQYVIDCMVREAPAEFVTLLTDNVVGKPDLLMALYTYIKAREYLETLQLSDEVMLLLITRIRLTGIFAVGLSPVAELLSLLFSKNILNKSTVTTLLDCAPQRVLALQFRGHTGPLTEEEFKLRALGVNVIAASQSIENYMASMAAQSQSASSTEPPFLILTTDTQDTQIWQDAEEESSSDDEAPIRVTDTHLGLFPVDAELPERPAAAQLSTTAGGKR